MHLSSVIRQMSILTRTCRKRAVLQFGEADKLLLMLKFTTHRCKPTPEAAQEHNGADLSMSHKTQLPHLTNYKSTNNWELEVDDV